MIRIILTCSILFCHRALFAQEGSLSTGGNVSSSGGSMSYSVGQVFSSIYQGDQGNIVEGYQQSYAVALLGGIDNQLETSLSVYPNPTVASLTLKIVDYKEDNLSYKMFDLKGNMIISQSINAAETLIDMKELPAAVYFISIVDKKDLLKTFRVIKGQ
jgi:hypothetical protein